MSWCDPTRRGLLAAGGALALSGCLRPMLAEDTTARALDGRISFPRIDGRQGYFLVRRLEDRLGTPARPDFALSVGLDLRTQGLAIAQDRSITRRTVTATARWQLLPRGAEAPVLTGQEIVESGYNESGDLYATEVAARDIERRVVEEIAERIARTIQAEAERVAAAAPA